MLAEIGKFVGAKVATVLIFIATIAGCWWCYENWDLVKAGANVVKLTLFWLILVAALPWTSYAFMKPLLRLQSSIQSETAAAAVSIGLIAVYCLIDIIIAFSLGDWEGGFTWFVVILGFIAAGAYNFVICESLARHLDG